MSLPNSRRTSPGTLVAATSGIESRELCSIRFDRPTPYRLRLAALIRGGTADAGNTLNSSFYVDDGFGDGESVTGLSLGLDKVTADRTATTIIEGVGLDVTVRVVCATMLPSIADRETLASAAIAAIVERDEPRWMK